MIQQIRKSLRELGFKPHEIQIYVALTQLGESPASIVAKKANMPRTTAISILNKLCDENYASAHVYKGKTYYWVESPKTIVNTLEGKLNIANELDELLGDLYRSEADFPHAQICDSRKSIKAFIEKTINSLGKNETIWTIDTPAMGNYRKIFSDELGRTLNATKRKKGIATKTLVPFGSFKDIHPEKMRGFSIEIREMPEAIKFGASIWFVGGMLVLFSGKHPFVVAVRHNMIVPSMKSVYEFVWGISRPMK